MVEQHAADTLQPFLDRLREALTAVANGDPEPMKALLLPQRRHQSVWVLGRCRTWLGGGKRTLGLGGGAVRVRSRCRHQRHRLLDGEW